MGKVGKFIVGAVLIVGGAIVGIATGNWQVGLMMASAGVGILTRPKIPTDLARDQGYMVDAGILRTTSGLALPVIYGTTMIGGAAVDVRPGPLAIVRCWS